MGALAKAIGLQSDDEVKERLEFLHVTAKAKLTQYQEQLNEAFINPESVAKAQIPGQRSIRFSLADSVCLVAGAVRRARARRHR